ncbi:PPP1R37 family protein [Megaselia abdita]
MENSISSEEELKEHKDELQENFLRRVSFPKSELVTGYLEPPDPHEYARKTQNRSEIVDQYSLSCDKHHTKPKQYILKFLKDELDIKHIGRLVRQPILSLRYITLSPEDCESLEEIFKRVQFTVINLSNCDLNDLAASALFGIIDYYEAAVELDVSNNPLMSNQSWDSATSMIGHSQVLQIFHSNGNPISSHIASKLGKSVNSSFLHTLKLEHCGLHNSPIRVLCYNLSKNKSLKELWLGYNDFTEEDATHLAFLLEENFYLQFIDLSNNNLKDEGVRKIITALIKQSRQLDPPNLYEDLIRDNISEENHVNGRSMLDSILTESIENTSNSFDSSNEEPDQELIQQNNNITDMANVDVNKNTDTLSSLESFSGDSAIESTVDIHPIKDLVFTSINHKSDTEKIDLNSVSRQSCESDSLCSDEGICSNNFDKLKKNDTLTRQKQNVQYNFVHRNPNGLKGLVLWNNNLTKSSAQHISHLLESSLNLELLNIGKNNLGNDFIMKIENSLSSNKSLSNLGLQSGHLSCSGIKLLATTLQSGENKSLKRIDLRDNFLKTECMNTLIDMLKSNNSSVKQIDLDDIPKRASVGEDIENDYYLLLQKVKSLCLERGNKKPDKSNTSFNRGAYSLTARKISLTCENSYFRHNNKENSIPLQIGGRKNGDRLRSPVPSPPSRSPNSSPIPSPSRSRFHVSKVPESGSPASLDNFQLSPNSRFFVVRVPNKDAIKSPAADSTLNPIVPINSNTDATQKCTNKQNNDNFNKEAQLVLNNDHCNNSEEKRTEKLEFLFEPEPKQFGTIDVYKEVVENDEIDQTTSLEWNDI